MVESEEVKKIIFIIRQDHETYLSFQILCSGKIKYAGQPYGIVVANSRDIALMAADLVRVSYSNVSKPALNLQDVLTMNKYDYIPEGYVLKPLQTPGLIFREKIIPQILKFMELQIITKCNSLLSLLFSESYNF